MKWGLNAIPFLRHWGKAVLIWVNAFLSKASLFLSQILPKNNCCTSFSVLSFMTKIRGKNLLVRSVSRMRHWRPSPSRVSPTTKIFVNNSLLAVKPLQHFTFQWNPLVFKIVVMKDITPKQNKRYLTLDIERQACVYHRLEGGKSWIFRGNRNNSHKLTLIRSDVTGRH